MSTDRPDISADAILHQVGASEVLAKLHARPHVWDTPVPLGQRAELPPFPAHVFPAWVADHMTAVAEETQTPLDLAGCVAMAALSTAAGGRAVVNVRGSWVEPVNLFVMVAMPPGSRKSAVFRDMTSPLRQAEKALFNRVGPQIVEAEVSRRLAVEAADKAARAATAARGEAALSAVAEAQSAALAVESIQIPVKPRLVADDITPEAAASLLAEQGGRLAVLSAEGGIFATVAGRYSGIPNLDLFLKGHAGDTLIVDRRGRTEHVEHAALTLGLAVQPEIIADIANMPGFRGKGLLGRILYSLPKSNVGYRRIDPPPVPQHVTDRYETNLRQLVIGMHDWDDPARLTLSPQAAEVFTAHRHRTEPRLRPDSGDLGHIADWAGKFDGAVTRIAGLIHLAAHIDDGWRHPITADTMNAAATLGEYFTAHALAAFDSMGADPDLEAARTVHTWLERTRPERFTVREAFRGVASKRFRKVADLETPLDLLEQLGWIQREPEPPRTGPGRRPSPAYTVHPCLSGAQQ
ncbi:YfjI family protein [Sphaerisporangium corydalis]|uniref:YfjI family protein n=1 Tax=Sphaerisporangium corydalis TaxID=1441875 RepID=A0ABV9EGP7_9ACTN|nr:YfjI family protein [Sphaerisporangium corydalis]